jgi:osmotically-inducible protein OsmY
MSITDEEIRKSVWHRLREDPQLAEAEIQAKVVEGKVILEGAAETYRTAAIAQEHASDVPGVKKVVNRISVKAPEKIAPPTDQAIRARIQAILALKPEMRPTDLVLAVADGIVFIDGFVETLKDKQEIHRMVERERGVLDVHNNLMVVPARQRNDHDIARHIVHALENDARVPENGLTVGVQMGSVTLTGTVADEAARGRVIDAVAGVSGVVELAVRLQVAEEKGTQ